ncbi:capping complex subunit for YIEGIA [Desulfolucanica intricata]|uniref:capping complex subunit for YIEGIA n=1 Tax=Desulfolucanica intricata TaxID=1285191 RepID=UPI000833F560|nr:hypothetical protein [Desulfolucanica intricata]
MDIDNVILAVVTTDKNKVSGGAPIFYAENDREKEKIAMYLSKATMGMVHDLENGCYIIIRH